jgi:hypothetical protein
VVRKLVDHGRDVIIRACRSLDSEGPHKNESVSKRSWARAALSHSAFIGISRHHLGQVIAELAGPWQARRDSDLRWRRGRDRLRAEGAGRGHDVVFTDRVLVTLAVLRLQIPHAALAVMYGVHRSTVTWAVREVRPLLAGRGYATPQGQRLHTLADVFAYAAACGIRLRLDGSEVQVRRPPPGCTTRLRCRPTASMPCWSSPPTCRPRWTPATGACAATTPARSASRPPDPARTRRRR